MFSSFFGGRKAPKKGRGGDAPVISAPLDGAQDGDDGGVLTTGGAHDNTRRRRSRSDGNAHPETLISVIRSQKRRARRCQRLAEKAEELRDSSEDPDVVAEQEGIRKAQIDLWIVLTAQINVLERVAAETDIYATDTGLNEDLDAAEIRQAREEEEYHRNQDALRAQQQETEETSYLITRSTEMPLDHSEVATMENEIDEFNATEFLPARHD